MRLRPLLPLLVLALALAAGCRDVPPTSPRLQARVAGLFEEAVLLPVGESLTLTGANAQAVFLDGGAEGAEFLYLPFSAASAGSISLTVLGGNVLPPAAPASLGLETAPAGGPALSAAPLPDEDFHRRLRERERREMAPFWRAEERPAPSRERVPLAQRVPAVGEVIPINVSLDFCEDPIWRQARVAAVTERAIVLDDLANPPGRFTDAEYRSIGETFDTLLYPLSVRNFGEPTDIDDNRRVYIFYTRAVNDLTPPGFNGFVAGFFYVRDLIPQSGLPGIGPCPGSNEAEIFYMLVPGVGQAPPRESLLLSTLGTVVHEFQHLINASRRIYRNDAETLEETWLDEALSHVAEELAFYEASGLGPRQNIDLDDLRTSQRTLDAVNTYQVQNILRYMTYLESATQASPLGPDDLATRGSAWAYLRYVADQRGAPETPFFFQLANSRTSGIQNLSRVLNQDPLELMRTWSAAVLTDDAVPGLSPRLTQPSWNFRSVVPALLPPAATYPLQVEPLQPETERRVTLEPGSAAYLRFGVGANQRAIIIANPDGAPLAPTLRVELVRVR